METILRDWKHNIPVDDIVYLVYASTPEDCGLRKLIVSLLLWGEENGHNWKNVKEQKGWVSNLPVDFCHDLLIHTKRKQWLLDMNPFNRGKADANPFKDEERGK